MLIFDMCYVKIKLKKSNGLVKGRDEQG